MRNIAIIPARSGSKGLKDKNIKELNGLPMIAYSIKAAEKSHVFDEIMVSTDSEHYRDVAIEVGANVPFLRSHETSTDVAGSWDVVKEVLLNYYNMGERFDTIYLLQPTSPLRRTEDIIGAYRLLEQKHAQAITSVCEMDHSPLWTMCLDETLSLKKYREACTNSNMPRQNLPTYYRINGALYIRKIAYINNDIQLLDEMEYAYIMPRENSIDIDTEEDFEMADFYLRKR